MPQKNVNKRYKKKLRTAYIFFKQYKNILPLFIHKIGYKILTLFFLKYIKHCMKTIISTNILQKSIITWLLVAIQAFVANFLYAQNITNTSNPIFLKWNTTLKTINEPLPQFQAPFLPLQTLQFENCNYRYAQSILPFFTQKIKLPAGTTLNEVILENQRFEPLTTTENQALGMHPNLPITTAITAEIGTAYEKKIPFGIFTITPLRKNPATQQLEKLISFEYKLITSTQTRDVTTQNIEYTNTSVLNQGTFYKIKTNKTGIHQLTPTFLTNLGIQGAININNLRVYGNGGGMLPEKAGSWHYDDLAENPIKVYDNNNNGLFDGNDYALFFAENPNKIIYNTQTQKYSHQTHFYSNDTYYFVNVDIGAGKRITNAPVYTDATQTVTEFDEYLFYEIDDTNVNHSGRRLYGEQLSLLAPQLSFDFEVENKVADAPVLLNANVMARSLIAQTSYSFYANNQLLNTNSLTLPKTTADYTANFGFQALYAKNIANITQDNINITIQYNAVDASDRGFLDYVSLYTRRKLIYNSQKPLLFKDAQSLSTTATPKIIAFEVQNLENEAEIWDVTHPDSVQTMQVTNQKFNNKNNKLRWYIAFNPKNTNHFLQPEKVGKVLPQNLHSNANIPDMVLVTHPLFKTEAQRLADFHLTHDGITTLIVEPEQIYNEFSGGTPDISALRNYLKMFFRKSTANGEKMPKYLLLLGDASYYYKGDDVKNENFVPTYQDLEGIQTTSTYCTDDYFVLLDDNEGADLGGSYNLLDMAVGRLPVRTLTEAQEVVNKIIHYTQPQSLGDWQNTITFIADDEDNNTYFTDCEGLTKDLKTNYPQYNINKIYLDAYQQEVTAGGARYPQVADAINNQIFTGTFLMNYIGHGGEDGWAHERILRQDDINRWQNTDKLPLFVTATCSFSRYDNPQKHSAGELVLLKPNGGCIAIVTTVRLVYAGDNEKINKAFTKHLFEPINNTMPTIGEVTRLAKNDPDAVSTGENNRKFTLLGDPALTLSYPQNFKVQVHTVNNQNISIADTLKALSLAQIKGNVTDNNNNVLTNFNGTVFLTVFDKQSQIKTLKNDPSSKKDSFLLRKNVIFKGRATATNGEFVFNFIVPKDIDYNYGTAKISLYAENGEKAGNGYTENVLMGGISNAIENDNTGPEIQLFMNNKNFVTGGITNPNPVLLAKIKDQNGINTSESLVGHNITAVLDAKTENSVLLNQFYTTNLNDYTQGEVKYPYYNLSEGLHTLELTAFDVHNNAGKAYTEFIVADNAQLALKNVLNYPNPFTTNTAFWFEHNRPNQPLRVTVQIFSSTGKVIKTIQQDITADGFHQTNDITWNGTDDYGNNIGKGVYIYKLTLTNLLDNSKTSKIEKLVLLK